MTNHFVRNNIRDIVASRWITSWRSSVSMVIGIYIALMLVECAEIGLLLPLQSVQTGQSMLVHLMAIFMPLIVHQAVLQILHGLCLVTI